jgi:hypothetical protein
LNDALKNRFKAHNRNALENAFRQAWSNFHDSYSINEAELVSTMESATRNAISVLNPADLSAVCSLFRQLGRESLADELIDLYVEHRQGTPDLFDLPNSPFGSLVKDKKLRAAFALWIAGNGPGVSLRQAVETISENRGWSRSEARALELATSDEFYVVFKGPLSVRPRRAIDACFTAAGNLSGDVHAKVFEAVKKIAAESSLNELRLKDVVNLKAEEKGADG